MNDVPIYVGFGHIVPKMVGGALKYKVEFFPKMVRGTPRPVRDAGVLTNRKKHRELRAAVSKATMFLTGKPFMTDAKTKGDSLEFTTPSVEATIFE